MSRLSNADAAWLHMELPDNPMTITGLLYLSRSPERAHMEAVLEHRLCRYERFRMKVSEGRFGVGVPHWEQDPDFQVCDHLVYEELEEPTEAALLARCGELMSEPLDRRRPLWEFRVFPGIDGKACLVVRLHHAIADGIALMKVLLTLCDELQGAPIPQSSETFLEEQKVGAFEHAKRLTRKFLHDSHEMLWHPGQLVEFADKGLQAGQSLTRVLTLGEDCPNAFRGELSRTKRTAVSRAYCLIEIKSVCKTLGCTINDFLVGVLAGALGRTLRRAQDVPLDLEIRAVVPVDLRAGKPIKELGNQFGLVFLTLPVGLRLASERILAAKQHMETLKCSAEAVVTFELLSTVGALPSAVERPIIEWFGNKATAVVTNLPGPRAPLYLAGVRLDGIMYWVPQSGRLGLGISLMSYAGEVRIGVTGDAGIIPDPAVILADFEESYQESRDCRHL